MSNATKTVHAELVEGQWKVEISAVDLPLTLRDQRTLSRAVLVATKAHIKQWNLKQRAIQRENASTSTAQKELVKNG